MGKLSRALQRLYFLAKELEKKGDVKTAKILLEIHDTIKFDANRFAPPREIFEGIPPETLQAIARVVGKGGYDPRTLSVATAILLTRKGGKARIDEIAKELHIYKSHIATHLQKMKTFRVNGDTVELDPSVKTLVEYILQKGDQND